jgi:hypothetical protein
MAGDWLKFDKSTPEKPEVFEIAADLQIDIDAVVGKLMRIWSWFDSHTEDGNASRVTPALLDGHARHVGFVAAMQKVGWIVVENGGVSLPKFDRHCGRSAKSRANGSKRSADYRGRNAASVTGASPEKRREEKKEQEQRAGRAQAPAAKATRLTADWTLPDTFRSFVLAERSDVDPDFEAAKFRDYWLGVAGKQGTKLDWEATWRNWIRRADATPAHARRRSGGNVVAHPAVDLDPVVLDLIARAI